LSGQEKNDSSELLARIEELERELRDARERLKQYSKSLPAGFEGMPGFLRGLRFALNETMIIGYDRDGRYLFIWIDPQLEERYAIDTRALVGNSLSEVFPADVAEERIAKTRQIFETGRRFREEYLFQTPGGGFWHDATIAPLRDDSGEVVAAIAIIQDITRSKRAEHKLAESEERYRGVVEQTSDAIVIHRDGEIVYANPATVRILGFEDPAELKGRKVVDITHPDSRESAIRRIVDAARSNKPLPLLEEKFIGKDGKIFYGEAVSQRISYEGKAAILSVVRDITERREAELLNRRLQKRIQNAEKQESLAVLAGGVAHDFNNLLMGVLGNASLLNSELKADSPLYKPIERIEQAATRAADLTRQLLAYAGKGKVELQPMDLPGLIEEMTNLLRASISKRIELRFDFKPGLPPVDADATQMRQVMMNLLLNAAEAIGDRAGKIEMSCKVVHADKKMLSGTFLQNDLEEGDFVSLEIVDDGCGMDKETRSKMFDPFFSTKFTGRGLGLASVLSIIRSHGGAIRVASRPEGGTTFQMLLAPSRSDLAEAPLETGGQSSPGRLRTEGLALVVDDEEHVREVLVATLRGAGLAVEAASDGEEAIKLFESMGDDLKVVVLDATMPNMSGEEVLAHFKQNRPDLPVIMISGYQNGDTGDEPHHTPPDAFIAKPFRPATLLEKLRYLLEDGK